MKLSGELPDQCLARVYRSGVRITGSARLALGALTSRLRGLRDGNSPHGTISWSSRRSAASIREEEVRDRARVAARARIAASPATPATPGKTVSAASGAGGARHDSLRAPNPGA